MTLSDALPSDALPPAAINPADTTNPPMVAQLLRMTDFLATCQEIRERYPSGSLPAPAQTELFTAQAAMYDAIFDNDDEDDDDQELIVAMAMLPSIKTLADDIEQFEAEVAGELLLTARALVEKLRRGFKTLMARYDITEAELADMLSDSYLDDPTA